MIRIGRILQSHWDWRAACNFAFGGTGGALLALAMLRDPADRASLTVELAALALVGIGLGCVWLEIGRPWRAMNVFRHPQRSWMTREAIVASATFALALGGLATGALALSWAAGLGGLAFLYCQARILKAARGVPAWREAAIVPLIVATGLAEASGLMAAMLAPFGASPVWLTWVLLAAVTARALAWLRYCSRLKTGGASEPTLLLVNGMNRKVLGFGAALPAALVIAAALMSGAITPYLLTIGGLLALLPGWSMKFTLVTRAAHLQGYAFGKLQRGHPLTRASG